MSSSKSGEDILRCCCRCCRCFLNFLGTKTPDSRLISTSYVTKIFPHEFSNTGQKIGKAAQTNARQISTMASPVGVALFQLKSISDCSVGVRE